MSDLIKRLRNLAMAIKPGAVIDGACDLVEWEAADALEARDATIAALEGKAADKDAEIYDLNTEQTIWRQSNTDLRLQNDAKDREIERLRNNTVTAAGFQRFEAAEAVVEAALVDLDLLAHAVEERDPLPEIKVRVDDLRRRMAQTSEASDD